MINLYRTSDRTLYLHDPLQSEAIQLDAGTPCDRIEQVVQKIADGDLRDLVIIPMKYIHEAQADTMTDILYTIDLDITAFHRRYIALLELDLKIARLPHPLQADVMGSLEGILAELQNMPPLVPLASVQGKPEHEAWIEQSTQMTTLYNQAEYYASWLAPKPIQAILTRIRQQRNLLRGQG